MDLDLPIENFSNIGPQYLKRLKKLNIGTIGDLFFHLPSRYENFGKPIKIKSAQIGNNITIEGEIQKIKNITTFKKRMVLTQALVKDTTGMIRVVWFNQPYLIQNLKRGDKISLAGRINISDAGPFLSNPAYEKITKNKTLWHTRGIVPIYPETKGVSSRWLRFILWNLLRKYYLNIQEFLPKEILVSKKLPQRNRALISCHFPKTFKEAEIAKNRLVFEELFLLELKILTEKRNLKKEKAPKIKIKRSAIEKISKSIPFKLTQDQKTSLKEIIIDLAKGSPMSRLLEGEVGSGKTVIAAIASFLVMENDYQVAIMTPTEILAEQHFKEISKLSKNFNFTIGLLTSSLNIKKGKGQQILKIKKQELIKETQEGKINLLIGTHSLIQEKIVFKNLALVIIDEQHRFGVKQRARLCRKSNNSNKKTIIPHFLSMTATPIPRSLALSFYGDLDISQIKQLPSGRKKIVTKIIGPSYENEVLNFIEKELESGRQVFVVCPLIEESEKLEVSAIKSEYEKIQNRFKKFYVGMLHGKMRSQEKEKIMKNFKGGQINILVSTPVIEVGIDVPNASVMMIRGAERFGLAQLYQLRGRIGRGKFKGYCFLMTQSPSKTTWQRLKAIEGAKNSFELAEKDLKIRGPGDFIGERQWGLPDFLMASLDDISLLQEIKEEAQKILEKDSRLKNYPKLKESLKKFSQKIHLE